MRPKTVQLFGFFFFDFDYYFYPKYDSSDVLVCHWRAEKKKIPDNILVILADGPGCF